jgi:hypothetical protein
MRLWMICCVAALTLACAPPEQAQISTAGCDARAASVWQAGEAKLIVEASAQGPDCGRAVALMVIRDASGAPLYANAHFAAEIMTLANAADQNAMQAALSEWVDSSNTSMATTGALPAWLENAAGPASGEFPFYPDEHVDRRAYLALRAQDLPLFCYVQGMESLRCLAFSEGGIDGVGVQLFAG